MKALTTKLGGPLVIFVILLIITQAHADRLRKLDVGESFPAFTLVTPQGRTVSTADYKNKVLMLIFLSAEQTSSEEAAIDAARLIEELENDDLELLFVSRDVIFASYFQEFLRSNQLGNTMCFDTDRKLSEQVGLIVLPTTLLIDRKGQLAHVISIHRSDYAQTLKIYAQNTLGLIDDEQMHKLLTEPVVKKGNPESLASRHRAVARLLREKGLLDNAQRELRTALELNPDDVECQLDLASLLIAVDRLDDAGKIVDTVLYRNAQDRQAQLLRAIILYREGQLAEAEKLFQKLLVLNPDPARTHYYLGQIYEQQGQQEKAMHHYREALIRFMGDEIE